MMVILNHYFGQNYERLPDRSYFGLGKERYYQLTDVTEELSSEQAPLAGLAQ